MTPEVQTDYQGMSLLIASASGAAVAVLSGLVTVGLQIATFIRSGQVLKGQGVALVAQDAVIAAQAAAAQSAKKRDVKMAEVHDLVNGAAEKINRLTGEKAFVAGGDAERANPTEPT